MSKGCWPDCLPSEPMTHGQAVLLAAVAVVAAVAFLAMMIGMHVSFRRSRRRGDRWL